MIFSFVCYAVYAGMAFMAHGIVSGAEGEALTQLKEKLTATSTGGRLS